MSPSIRKAFSLALVGAAIGGTALVQACSATPDGGGGSSGGTQNGQNQAAQCAAGNNAVSTTAGSCKNPTIPIVFSSMYSAYVPGDSLRSFSIPVVTQDGCPVTWSVSDPSQVILHAESFGAGGATTPGAMLTTKGTGGAKGPETTGEVTVYATDSTGACGAAVLTITQNTDDDWSIGNARYANGVSLHLGGSGPATGPYAQADGGSFQESDGGTACASCHSQTVKTGQYADVAHTPEQAGGFSDTEMKDIILSGEVADGGYFDPSVIDPSCTTAGTTLSPSMASCGLAAYAKFRAFHQWPDIGADQVPGMICYLRSLPPEGQAGTSNFGAGH
ncbi:MAG TPA: hypothetical protein VGI39_37055 [Polyangiaceae bacterium]|jgi:hypothetical protein